MNDTASSGRFPLRLGVWIVLFLGGAGLRFLDVCRPVDGRVRESWRECDYAAVARNYIREDMNILSPRIDWRGRGPGLTEMEFPILPWTIAVLYKIFGFHEVLGRILVYLISLLAMLVFFALARRLLPPWGAPAASLFFILSPLAIRVSNSLQPEGLMLLLYLAAAYAFLRWLEEDSWGWYAAALAATAAVILVKIPAAHIGIFFLALVISRKGIRGVGSIKILAFGALALLPGLLWYLHAHRFWLEYGNSLGVSNEYHWIGWDMVGNPGVLLKFFRDLCRIEAGLVWTPVGILAAPAAIWLLRRDKTVRIAVLWLIAVGLYYLVAIRTTADGWAAYYHVVTIPAAALVLGSLADFVRGRAKGSGRAWPILGAIAGLSIALFQGAMVIRDFHPRGYQSLFDCARAFKPIIPEGSLILASGGSARDETGRPVAFNASYMFYWLDRKGFNIPSDGQSLDSVRTYVQKGVRYFVLEKSAAEAVPGFLEGLIRNYTLVAECPAAYLFKF